MKRIGWICGLFFLTLYWVSSAAEFLGVYRNSTGTNRDTVYFHGTFFDSLAMQPVAADSVYYIRERGTTFIDSLRGLFSADSLAEIGAIRRTGQFRRAFRASDASGNPGIYRIHVMAWKNGNHRDPAGWAQSWDAYYEVWTDPPGDVDTSDVSLAAKGSNGGTIVTGTDDRVILSNSATHGGSAFLLTGDRMVFTSTSGAAWSITGQGSGAGLSITGGGTGRGVSITAGGGNQIGLSVVGAGTQAGISATGGSNGHGLALVGGSASGDGLNISVTDGDGIDAGSGGAGNVGYKGVIGDTTGIIKVWNNVEGNVTGSVGSVASGGITSGSFAAGAITQTVVEPDYSTLTASDNIGINWGDITNPTATQGLSGTQVHVYDTDSIGQVAVVEQVGTNAITATSFAGNAITASAIAADAIGSSELAGSAALEIADTVWDERQDGHTVGNSFGLFVDTTISSRASSAGGGITQDQTWQMLQAMWGIPFASADQTFTNGDTLTKDQRTTTSVNPCATCTFGTLYTDTVYTWNTTSSSTIPNVNVQVRNSSGTVVGTFQTNASGKFTGTFDAGTYLLYPYFTSGIAWASTDNPDTFVVTGNAQIDTIKGQTISYPAPPVGGQISVSGNVFDLVGDSMPGVTVEFSLNQNAYFSTDDTTNMSLVAKEARSRQTDVSGRWSVALYPTTKLLGDDRRKGVYYTCKIYMPDGITTYENSGQITFSHDNCCQVFQYKNYRPWVTQ